VLQDRKDAVLRKLIEQREQAAVFGDSYPCDSDSFVSWKAAASAFIV